MIWAILEALKLSAPLRWALIAVVGWGGFELWKINQRNIGARVVQEKIEKKADADDKLAKEVDADTAAGRVTSRVRNPFERSSN